MTGPRDPTPHEAELPDDLADSADSADIGQSAGARQDSGDAELVAGQGKDESDVENATSDDLGRTND